MTEPAGVIRRIEWRELFPWLILFRTFRIAISPTLLALATVAVLISPLGWSIAGRVFLSESERQALQAAHLLVPRAENSLLAKSLPLAPLAYLPTVVDTALLEAYFSLAEPLHRVFRTDISLGQAAYYACGFLWTLAVWAFPGGVITRRAITQLATDSASGLRSEAIFAGRRYLWYFLTPLYPLLGIVLLAVPIAILGLLVWLAPNFGTLLAGLAWLLIAIVSLGAMWLFGGLIFGWPLMWPTISAERDGDPFEAFSRSYSYVYGKPLHYFFYVAIAAAFGALCWAVVSVAVVLVQEFGFWALSWGAGGSAAGEIRDTALDIAAGELDIRQGGAMWRAGVSLVGLVLALIHSVETAFRYTFFFTVAAAIYLLLRHDVDEKEMDEVYLGDDRATDVPPATAASPPAAPTAAPTH
jgi:hypothetical protein